MTSPERRETPRLRVESLVLIDIGEDNAGIISDISEGGLCFQVAAPIEEGGTVDFRLRPDDLSQGAGRVVWTDETQKRGGLSFTELSVHTREQIYALITELAIPGVAAAGSEELRQGEDSATNSVQLSLVSVQAVLKGLFRGFTGGLVTGVLVSLLVSAALLCRRQIGESLIVVGEHLASKSPSLTQSTHNLGETTSAPNTTGVRYPQTIATSKPESQQRTNGHDSTSSLRQVHGKGESPTVAQKSQTTQLSEQEHSNPTAPHAAQSLTRDSTAKLLPGPSTPRPEQPKAPSASRIAMLGLAKPSQPQPSNDLITRVVSYNSNIQRGSSSQMYFEVGRFKQHPRASQERDKLTQLGYPAIIQQKRRLWRNFYDVLVGPYHESDEAEMTHKSLVARGFQARPVERGYRDFILPPHLILNGVATPVGDCIIRWESYIAEVKVKFEQNNQVISTAHGTWVKRDPKYRSSAIVYTRNRDGSRTLDELRFEGLTRALVFSN